MTISNCEWIKMCSFVYFPLLIEGLHKQKVCFLFRKLKSSRRKFFCSVTRVLFMSVSICHKQRSEMSFQIARNVFYFIMLVPNKTFKCNFQIHNYTCVSYSMTTCVYYNIWNERGKHIIQHQLHLFNAFHWFKATINSDFTINLKDNSKQISLFLCLNMCVLIICPVKER